MLTLGRFDEWLRTSGFGGKGVTAHDRLEGLEAKLHVTTCDGVARGGSQEVPSRGLSQPALAQIGPRVTGSE